MKGAFHRNAAGMSGLPDRIMGPGGAARCAASPRSDARCRREAETPQRVGAPARSPFGRVGSMRPPRNTRGGKDIRSGRGKQKIYRMDKLGTPHPKYRHAGLIAPIRLLSHGAVGGIGRWSFVAELLNPNAASRKLGGAQSSLRFQGPAPNTIKDPLPLSIDRRT